MSNQKLSAKAGQLHMAKLLRIKMHLDCQNVLPDLHHGNLRRLDIRNDLPAVAQLMVEAYENSVDREDDHGLAFAKGELNGLVAGKYGAYISAASFVAEESGVIVSAALTTLWRSEPLLAYLMTSPRFQGQGLGRSMLSAVGAAIRNLQYPGLKLVVTEANESALSLYRGFGFKEL